MPSIVFPNLQAVSVDIGGYEIWEICGGCQLVSLLYLNAWIGSCWIVNGDRRNRDFGVYRCRYADFAFYFIENPVVLACVRIQSSSVGCCE
jgi:hypothetical protein